jgi:hypothetical protein
LKPDFKTIADFRSDNCDAFRSVFRQFVLLCRELDLFGRQLLAVDGTRFKAVNNKNRPGSRNAVGRRAKAVGFDEHDQAARGEVLPAHLLGRARCRSRPPRSSH